ncbi:MAG: ABC transporter permease, partial [Longicatena sp.]
MNKKKRVALAIFLMALFDLLIFVCVPNEKIAQIEMNITLESDETGDYQVFYSKDGIFSMEQMQTIPYEVAGEKKVLSYVIPVDKNIWRVDFGDSAATVKVHAIELKSKGHKVELDKTALVDSLNWNGLVGITDKDKYVEVKTTNADPRCVLNVQEVEVKQFITNVENDVNRVKRIIACVMLDIVVFAICLLGNKIYSLIKEVFQNRKLVFKLAKNDFKTRFVGSYLGIIWAFIQPVVTVLVYLFVFQVGLRSGDVGDFPFVLWLIAGLVPWFFFQEALSSGTNALIEYQYLVKKIVFKISTLPVVKVLSALFVHLFFILFTLVLYSFYGYFPDL